MDTGTLTSKGQTTVPKKVREALGLKPGDVLRWTVEDGRAVVRAKNRSIREFAGMLHRPGMRALSLQEIDDAIAAAAIESAMGGSKPDR